MFKLIPYFLHRQIKSVSLRLVTKRVTIVKKKFCLLFFPWKGFVERILEEIEDDSNRKLLYIICCMADIAGIARKSLIHVFLPRTLQVYCEKL